jgi:hypothetical protein
MRDLIVELKQLRLHGMAAGWAELLEQGNVEVAVRHVSPSAARNAACCRR